MSILWRIILGSAITMIGFFFVWRTDLILNWFGRSWWAETKLGGGGTRLMYKVIGVLASFIGIIVATDLFDILIGSTLTNLFS